MALNFPQARLLANSIKSKHTEEVIDLLFYRRVGLRCALFAARKGITPNQISILSIFLGVIGGGLLLPINLYATWTGILMIVCANILDSTDGQLARLTRQFSQTGRVLDGVCGDLWFISIYLALTTRLYLNGWGWWIYPVAGFMGLLHAKQSSMADYYRNAHLYFLRGRQGSEWDDSAIVLQQAQNASWKRDPLYKIFQYFYTDYTRSQEQLSPRLQTLRELLRRSYPNGIPKDIRQEFIRGSRPLMPYTNILTFNTRIICLFAAILLNIPWLYFLISLTVFTPLLVMLVYRHERLSQRITNLINRQLLATTQGVILDYGATLDSNGDHWSEIIYQGYVAAGVKLSKQLFIAAYVHGERTLATQSVVQPTDTYLQLMQKKIEIEATYINQQRKTQITAEEIAAVANYCDRYARTSIERARPGLDYLHSKYPLVIVSNFYGNLNTVLATYGIDNYFSHVIESATAGVRKPDPSIFKLGVEALDLNPHNVTVIGDSTTKDIAPAQKIGCLTIKINGISWDKQKKGKRECVANKNINDFVSILFTL